MRDLLAAARTTARPSPCLTTGAPFRSVVPSWLLLGVVLAGLFAMHGLGTHGTHAAHTAEPMPMVAGMSTVTAAPLHTTADTAGGAALATTVVPDGSAPTAHPAHANAPHVEVVRSAAEAFIQGADDAGGMAGMGALVGLCFAVLSALAAWALTRAGRGRMVALVRLAAAAVAPAGGRDPDPPSRFVLSVHRC